MGSVSFPYLSFGLRGMMLAVKRIVLAANPLTDLLLSILGKRLS